jgi:hypothetical protein
METRLRQFAHVFAIEPGALREVEGRILAMDFLQLEEPDDFLERNFFPIVLRRPAEETEIIADRFGEKTILDVCVQTGACVALAHLRAVLVEDKRDVREARRLRAESAIQLDVLGRVREMIFAPE